MNVITTKLPGLFIIEPDVHGVHRFFFKESYHRAKLAEHGMLPLCKTINIYL